MAADVVASADAVTFRVQRTLDLVLNLDPRSQVVFDRGQLEIGGGVEPTTGRYTANFDVGEALTPTASTAPAAPPLWETEILLGAALLDLRVDVRRFSVVSNLGHHRSLRPGRDHRPPRDLRFDDTIHVERGADASPASALASPAPAAAPEFSPRRRVGAQTPDPRCIVGAARLPRPQRPGPPHHPVDLRRLAPPHLGPHHLERPRQEPDAHPHPVGARPPRSCVAASATRRWPATPPASMPRPTTRMGVTDELVRQVASNLLESRVAEPLRELSNLDVARIELKLRSFAFHAEKRLPRPRAPSATSSARPAACRPRIRLEQRLPHHQLSPLFTWLRGELSTVAAGPASWSSASPTTPTSPT
ncbi:MAG: hypothetical protein HS111_23785 [Kofleriaceae bacterium]|nr:hypothetical protein [Kofleriaceae bacterium]